MKRDTLIQVIALVGMLGFLTGAGSLVSTIDASASSAQLKYTDEASKGAPLAVTVAQSVGVLRGVMVNYLWIRAEGLKEDGKFFEAFSAADWITKLQPRFAKVWAFQAWNMAYNISVATHTKEERWKWVQDGIRLIRERGLKYNPNDMMLYKELSWYFMHKVGGFTDDAHTYYKQQLADRWQGILGQPPYDYEARMDMIRGIVNAPSYEGDLVEQYPLAAEVLQKLRAAGFEMDEQFLQTIEWTNAIDQSMMGQRLNLRERSIAIEDYAALPPDARAVYEPISNLRPIREDPAYAEVFPIVANHARGRVLREDYNMDPSYMLQYMEEYGPLDWRCPAAHSLYWAELGVERGLTRQNQVDFDRLNTDRLLFHSQQQLKFNGRIVYDFLTKEVSWGTDLRFIPYYELTFQKVLKREVGDAFGRGPTENYLDGYRNFLIDTVREYYMWGEREKAAEQYAKLRNDPRFYEAHKPDRFTYPISDFIIRESIDRHTSPQVATANILGSLVTGLRFGLARNDADAFNEHVNIARRLYDFFMDEIAIEVNITQENRLGFPDFNEMLRRAFILVMTTDTNSTLEERLTLWNSDLAMVDQLKLTSYDQIVNSLRTSYEQQGLPMPFDEAFPPPPGIEEYRIQQGQQQDDKADLQFERK